MSTDPEIIACTPHPVNSAGFNKRVVLPYECTSAHIEAAMGEFIDFLGFVNQQLNTKAIRRLETMLMPANFSSLVGEFTGASLASCCPTLVRNRFHNGHPDLLPAGVFPEDATQHASEGIEIKASRYAQGWQGHNPEDTWLLVFVFDSNNRRDLDIGKPRRPFGFVEVIGARLTEADWSYSGRAEGSRRTITASVTSEGCRKMRDNWIYRDPNLWKPKL